MLTDLLLGLGLLQYYLATSDCVDVEMNLSVYCWSVNSALGTLAQYCDDHVYKSVVCLSVCPDHHMSTNLTKFFVAVAQSLSGGRHDGLWMTSCFTIMGPMAQVRVYGGSKSPGGSTRPTTKCANVVCVADAVHDTVQPAGQAAPAEVVRGVHGQNEEEDCSRAGVDRLGPQTEDVELH